MVFVEDIDFQVTPKRMLGKHALDAGFGQFINILKCVCWKRQVYFAQNDKIYRPQTFQTSSKVDHIETSQICRNCGAYTDKKKFVASLKIAAEMTQTR